MRHSVSQRFSFVSLRLLLLSVSSHLTKKFPVLSYFMKIKSDSVSFHENKIWFCLISLKKNLILSHLTKKKIWFCFISLKKNWFCFILQKKISSHSDFDDLKQVKEDKVIIISHYYFLCKSESENSVSFWFYFVSSH